MRLASYHATINGMEESIFTKIIKGEIPCHKVYEDERTIVFMDIHPIQPGQVLVVPKQQVAYVWDLEAADYTAVMSVAKQTALKMRQVFPDAARIGMQIEGLDVDHAHIKVFPFDTDADFRLTPDPNGEPDHQALSAIAQKLAF